MRIKISVTILFATFLVFANAIAQDSKDIFCQASPAIVYIISQTKDNANLGSGFIVNAEGIVLTNLHIVSDAKRIIVKFQNGAIYPVAGIIYHDANRDICLLKIDAHALPVLPLANSTSVTIGDMIYTIGNPSGLEFTFSDGMISGIRDLQNIKYLQFTAPISPGNSGGPLLNSRGEAIGIVTASKEIGNLNFALAINEVKPFITNTPTPNPELLILSKAEAFLIQGNQLCLQQNYTLAIDCYKKAIELDPNYASAYNGLGLVYNDNIGAHDQAIRELTKAIELNPNFAEAYANRGVAYTDIGIYDQAILDFTKTIELNPNLAKVYNNRAFIYNAKTNYDQSILDCTKAIELDPNYASAYNNRGAAYTGKHNYDQAILDCTKAIELDPKFVLAYNNRGTAYGSQGKHEQAILDFTKTIELNPNYAEAYYSRGVVYYNKGNYDQSILDLTKAIELKPGLADAYISRGAVYYYKKEYNKAWADVHKAEELGYPADAAFLANLKRDSGRDK